MDSSFQPWTVLHPGHCLHPLRSTATTMNQSHCTPTPSSRILVYARTPGFSQPAQKFHTDFAQTLIGSCQLSGFGGYWKTPMSLGFKENLVFNPVCLDWNSQNSRDPTKVPQLSLQSPKRLTNKTGSRHQPLFTQSNNSMICLAYFPFPYDFISKNGCIFYVQFTT